MRAHPQQDVRRAYTARLLACLAATLLLGVALVHLWPAAPPDDAPPPAPARSAEMVLMEEITPTTQRRQAPPPPAPLPPVVLPDETVLEEVELNLGTSLLLTLDPGDDATLAEGGDAPPASGPTYIDARPIRFVEPEYTREARRRRVRAEVVVEVVVDEKGQVRDARILERFLLKGRDDALKEPVAALGYGIEEAVLTAARRWLFRPARRNGEAIEENVTLTFGVGV